VHSCRYNGLGCRPTRTTSALCTTRSSTSVSPQPHLRIYVLDLLGLMRNGGGEHLVKRRYVPHAALHAGDIGGHAEQHLLQCRILRIRHRLHLLLLQRLCLLPHAGGRAVVQRGCLPLISAAKRLKAGCAACVCPCLQMFHHTQHPCRVAYYAVIVQQDANVTCDAGRLLRCRIWC
jgi:hypothetical protein